jgi:hypothetical protein
MGDGAYLRMMGKYSGAVKSQLGKILVLGIIFPMVCLTGSGHAQNKIRLEILLDFFVGLLID